MLPQMLFEAITRAQGASGRMPVSERRTSVRLPVRGTVTAYRVDKERLSVRLQVRLRDMSTTGVAVVAPGTETMGKMFLIRLQPPGYQTVWILCKTVRHAVFDKSCTVTSGMFLKLMAPNQLVTVGALYEQYKWIEVEGAQTPTDEPLKEAS